MPTSKLLTAKQLAEELGVLPRTIASWRQRRLIPHIHAGHRSKYYRLTDVVAALERRTVKPRSLRNGE